jgi:sodium-coupled monocarboxylate transporter 8/12
MNEFIFSYKKACVFGIVVVSLSFLCDYLGNTVLQISLSVFGILGGPLLGVITLGMFIPYANAHVILFSNKILFVTISLNVFVIKGATIGLIISLVVNVWIGIGSVLYGEPPESKNFSTICNGTNITSGASKYAMDLSGQTKSPHSLQIYQLSYLWFSPLAILNVFAFGVLGTFLANFLNLNKNKKTLNANLTIDVVKKFKAIFKCGKKDSYTLVNLNETNPQNDVKKT